MKYTYLLPLMWVLLLPAASQAQLTVSGTVYSTGTVPLPGARVTLWDSAANFFAERRTDAAGVFAFNGLPAGNYILGATKRDRAYVQQSFALTASQTGLSYTLAPETNQGQWQILKQAPEPLGGTDLAVLLSSGKIFYCHDTKDPFYFDTYTNDTLGTTGDVNEQGCVGPVPLPNGEIYFAGGTDVPVYGPGIRKVKKFNPQTGAWTPMSDMLGYRWYPTVTKLADNRILVVGGGNQLNPQRTNSSELYNPQTGVSTWTDTIKKGNEVSPIVLLLNGKALMTHRPPQLFDPVTAQWSDAADFVQGNRMPNGDHSDHELTLMPNGKVVAIGYKTFNAPQYGSMVEVYDPTTNTWTLGAPRSPVRSRPNTVLLPSEKILVVGGEKENLADTHAVNTWKYMKLAEQYDPATDTWRRLANMNYFREYHAVPILAPDARVIIAGGEGQPGNEPPFSVIEGFKPPYLFKGIRPAIQGFTQGTAGRGAALTFNVRYADSVTGVVLYSAACKTHFMNSGNNRFVKPVFTQSGSALSVTLPIDSLLLPDGLYMLFVMVDDIPSVAQFVSINGASTTPAAISATRAIDSSLSIFPNPAGGTVTVRSSAPLHVILRIRDLNGKLVFTASLTKQEQNLSVAHLPRGLYTATLTQGGETITRKLILQ